MSHLDDLLNELCPDGVQHLPLSSPQVAHFRTGQQLNRNTLSDHGGYEVYNGGIGPSGRHPQYNTEGPAIIVSQGGASAGFVNYICEQFWAGAHCYVVTPGPAVERRFLYHVLKSKQATIQSTARGAGIPGLGRGALGGTNVPVPAPEVQREIVRILDHFTQLEAELEAELEARRNQYEHYRHALLETSEAAPHSPLHDLVDMRSGRFIAAAEISPRADPLHPYPCYGGNGLRGYVATCNQIGPKVLVGRQGALSGNVHRVSGEFYATEHAVVVTPREKVEIDIDWAFHMLTAMNLNQYVSQGAQPGLAVGTLKPLTVPLPPLCEQKHVASTLDKLDTLVNDLGYGLPAEIAARRKQYEYYRDRLLTFKEAAA